jgi:amino acid transporter
MTEFRRAIQLPQATAMVIGTIIGASIFVQASEVSSHVHSVWSVLLVWVLAGTLTLIGSLVCAELASIYPQTGGVYVYLREVCRRVPPDRRDLHLPQRDLVAGPRLPVGMGDAADDA